MAYLGNTIVNGVLKAINGISGNGSGITDINASNISTGTLNAERLPESYLPLAGGTLNGGLTWLGGSSGTALCGFKFGTGAAAANYYQPNFTSMDFGWNWDTGAGSGMAFRGTSYGGSQAGAFIFFARNSTSNYKQLEGYVDGTLKWTGSLFTVGGGTGTITGNITGNVLTGYTKPTTTSAIAATDTLNGAIGKLEKALDSKQTSINSARSIEFITGTQTAATGAFRGVTEDTSLYDGKCINYYLPYAGSGNATLELTFPDGSTSGAKSIFIVNSTRLTTHYSAGTIFQMTYSATKDAWFCGNYWYDSNTQGQYIYYYNTAYFRTAVTSGTIAVGDATGYAQAAGGVTFNISYPMLWVNTNIAAGGTNYANCFIQHYDLSLANVKPSFTSTKWKMIYLVVTISGMTATVDSEIITDTLPSTENGKVYIAIGRLGNQTNGKNYFLFQAMHPMYHYKNGIVRIYDPTTAETGSSNGTIKINGTDVAVKGLGTAAYTASTAYAAASHEHTYIKSPYQYSNNMLSPGITAETIFGENAAVNKLNCGFMDSHPLWNGYADVIQWTGYCKWGGTQLAAQYNASSNVRLAIRKYTQTGSKWGDWTEILTAGSSLNAAKLTGTVPASCISGFAATSHGNHVPTTQTANNAVFLRNDNTWQTVTPANIGAAASSHTHNYAGSSSAGGAATTALKVQNNPAAGADVDLVYSQMAANDYFRIRTGGASNAGYAELATADDGTEPIYVRQYTGVFSSLVRTATLLDGSGNTIFPGSVTVGSHGTIAYNSATGCIELSVA